MVLSRFVEPFQSRNRASAYSDLEMSMRKEGDIENFNPAIGLLPILTLLGIL